MSITWESHDAEQEMPGVQVSVPSLYYLGGDPWEVIRIPEVIKSGVLVSAVLFGVRREALGDVWALSQRVRPSSCYSASCDQGFVSCF